MSRTHLPVDWASVDTVLLDMDGTILDLAFDNHFWRVVVPAAYGAKRGLSAREAHAELEVRYGRVAGQLSWYCVDYWSAELELDIRGLKRAHRHLIGYLPGAVSFLRHARVLGRPLVIVTNAHPAALDLKLSQTRLDTFVSAIVSSHACGFAKEDPRFWSSLQGHLEYVPATSLLIEDSVAVVRTAAEQGLRTLTVRRPDSRQARRELDTPAAIDGLGDLVATLSF